MGTVNIFECAKELKNLRAIINVTTDKCYENMEKIEGYVESDKLGGYDPYSASKACSEIITNSYRDSFFNLDSYQKEHSTLIASARAGNVIGGGDWSEDRLIPDIIKSSINNKFVVIRNPMAIRPWQHVLESISGYLVLGQKLLQQKKKFSGAWNFGPQNNEFSTVEEITAQAKYIWPKISITHKYDETMHETKTLTLNSSKSREQLNWKSVWSIDETINKTICWYREYYENNTVITHKQIEEFISRARSLSYIWT
jgi:CDP-glucose 4,6-dehydratase